VVVVVRCYVRRGVLTSMRKMAFPRIVRVEVNIFRSDSTAQNQTLRT